MEGRRRYRNPPIEEALCEFYFDPSEEWDLTIPGKLHTELGDEYSGKPQQQNVAQVALAVKDGHPIGLQHSEKLGRIQLLTKKGTRMVGIGPGSKTRSRMSLNGLSIGRGGGPRMRVV